MNQTNSALLDVLTREGVLINVSVRYWRGCKKLKPEDLGLAPDDVSDRLISLGHKRLLPKDATADLALIESRAHAVVDANTFPFLNGLGHFLPNPRLQDVTEKLRVLEAEFWHAKDDFVVHYARHRNKAMEEWRTVATKLVPDPERLIAAIAGAFPLSLDQQFGFDVTLFQIALPEELRVEAVSVAEQRQVIAARQQAAHEAGAKIRSDVESFVAECVASLREQTATLCEEMLQSISSGKTEGVHQKTLNRLVRFIEQFRQMNFANDTAMEEQLEAVRRELLSRSAAEYRDSQSAQQKLTQGLTALADKARELARADTTELVQSFGQLGRRRFNLAA
ncbi:DUF3150 domain-containing protein [Verrucomicrobiota bacterium sgz303538]